jgi:hypothetical protein
LNFFSIKIIKLIKKYRNLSKKLNTLFSSQYLNDFPSTDLNLELDNKITCIETKIQNIKNKIILEIDYSFDRMIEFSFIFSTLHTFESRYVQVINQIDLLSDVVDVAVRNNKEVYFSSFIVINRCLL